ncbi:MAG: 16S rRNA (guanine(966)-N(2))-methyltransferase RsmD [Nocardioidaceae bacterium]
MSRIIAGTAGGRRLRTPSGSATRPTSDRVREALFSALESRFGSLGGLHVLDLFAGSGAVGLEALSRGAARAVLVERNRRTASLIAANARSLGLAGARVVTAKVETFVESAPTEAYDLVFCDPPYSLDSGVVRDLVASVTDPRWWKPGGMVVVERSARDREFAWPSSVDPAHSRKYGETVLWYGQPHA